MEMEVKESGSEDALAQKMIFFLRSHSEAGQIMCAAAGAGVFVLIGLEARDNTGPVNVSQVSRVQPPEIDLTCPKTFIDMKGYKLRPIFRAAEAMVLTLARRRKSTFWINSPPTLDITTDDTRQGCRILKYLLKMMVPESLLVNATDDNEKTEQARIQD
ncbi:unnamed protein product [Dovyalis caffra]|uniref:Uncharacterized protein n=1 Tax=Dovyalis caffra TaxID=77055 RepID=A0AAV1RZ37_9ROSI|nr:unnamed protein product [Dovyalis caffra]